MPHPKHRFGQNENKIADFRIKISIKYVHNKLE